MDPPKGLDDLLATGRPPTANVTDIPCPRTRYLVPGPLEPHPTNDPEGFYSGHATRFKLEDFSRSTMETFDLTQVNPPASEGLRGFCGGFTDGTWAYYVPQFNGVGRYEPPFYGRSGRAVRIRLDDWSASGVQVADLTKKDLRLVAFNGGFTAGGYAYYVPNDAPRSSGVAARIDLSKFGQEGPSGDGIEMLDLEELTPNGKPPLRGFSAGATDGTWAYYCPFNNLKIVGGNNAGEGNFFGNFIRVRLDDWADVNNKGDPTFQTINLEELDEKFVGFRGVFTTAAHVYLVPGMKDGTGDNQGGEENYGRSGVAVRVAVDNFTPSGVESVDLELVHERLVGFYGGFTDHTWVYVFCGPRKHHSLVPAFPCARSTYMPASPLARSEQVLRSA